MQTPAAVRNVRAMVAGAVLAALVAALGSAAVQVRTASAKLTRHRIRTTDWVTLRNSPGHYVVALGKNGWGDDVSSRSRYDYGYVAGSSASPVQACVYVTASALAPARTHPRFDCSRIAPVRPVDFMRFFNGNVLGVNCSHGSHRCDGAPVTLQQNGTNCPPTRVPVYSNVQPWAPNIHHDGRVIWSIPIGRTVKWRYVTRDGRFAMIRDPHHPLNDDWGFIPAGCIRSYAPQYPPPAS